MGTLWQDLRYAVRMLAKSPGFTAVAVLTLALGIGANTAIFSVVNAVLLRPLPYKDSNRLVNVWGEFAKMGIPRNSISEPEWWELKDTNQSFSELAGFVGGDGDNLTSADGQPVRVTAADATSSLFSMLGVQPIRGRIFTAEEDLPGHNHVVLLSEALWKSHFGGDPDIVGRIIHLDSESYTVVGVLSARFEFEGKNDIWVPLGLDRAKPRGRGSHYLSVLGRLKPGVAIAQASEDMNRFAAQLAREYPDYVPYGPDGGWGVYLVPRKDQEVGDVRPALLVLLGAVFFVLLIACANIANLLLARASSREREIAIRTALGAGKLRLVRQLLTESLLLSLIGGGLGLLVSYWCVAALRAAGPENLPRLHEVGLDPTVLAFTFGLSILTGLIFGLVPAFLVARAKLHECLKEGGRGTSAGVGGRRLRGFLVVSEIALALLLLVGAGLMIRSFGRLLEVNPGFQTSHLLTMQLSLPEARYKDGPPVAAFYQQLLVRVRAVPGVLSAGAVSELPLANAYSSGSVSIESTPVTGLSKFQNFPFLEIDRRSATSGYFEAMGIPLREGRLFTEADNDQAFLVAIVDTEFARHLWPNEDPLGKRVAIDMVPDSKPPVLRWRTVVGVVGHVKHYALDVEGREQAYFPQAQIPYARTMTLTVRAATKPTSLTSAISGQVLAIDREQPVYEIRTMDEWLSASLAQSQLNLVLLSVFAGLALVLAGVGIYGVMAYSVTQRTQEIGVRMALGAQPRDVLRLMVREGAQLAALGIALGLAASLTLTRLMVSLLFGVKATDPLTYAGVAVILAAVALAACYIPARRAMLVDPIVALRYE